MSYYSLLALLDALAAGALTIRFGRIEGRCGYTDPDARMITLNPDAPAEQIKEQLTDALEVLAIPEQRTAPSDEHDAPDRPHLQLLPGGGDEEDEDTLAWSS